MNIEEMEVAASELYNVGRISKEAYDGIMDCIDDGNKENLDAVSAYLEAKLKILSGK